MGMRRLDDSKSSVHPRRILRDVGRLPVHAGAVGLTKLVGGARRSQKFSELVHIACARVVVGVEMQAEELLHGIWIVFFVQWHRPAVAGTVTMAICPSNTLHS